MKPFFAFCLCFVFLLSSLSNGRAVHIVKNITVDHDGHGEFNSIQAAINSVPSGNWNWTRIHIRSGVYKQKVNLTADKGFIQFEGEGASQTKIEWGDFIPLALSNNIYDCATFTISATNVVFKDITFTNTYDNSMFNPARAIATLIQGDKISFYNCNFIGVQDTVCDLYGRHYFKDCFIQGAVDFIFGFAQSLYEGCTLSTVSSKATAGWVTAHGRSNPSDSTGFVFKNCKLIGEAKTYLGRAWGPNSRVIFYRTYMSDIIVPQGWDCWNDCNNGSCITYVESGCSGKGSNTEHRVQWEKKMSARELANFTSISFVDDGWLSQQGS